MPLVTIREKFKLIPQRNPVSGHEWHEHGPTTGFEIVGPNGVCDTARTQASADRKRDEWEGYYERNPPVNLTQTILKKYDEVRHYPGTGWYASLALPVYGAVMDDFGDLVPLNEEQFLQRLWFATGLWAEELA